MKGLRDKRALVTGGSKGIGLATAARLLDEGCRVVICATSERTVAEGLAGLAGRGEVHGLVCDVSDPAAVQRLVDETAALLGGIDILVNNAGIGLEGSAVDAPDGVWERTIAVNLSGAFYVARAVCRLMIRQGTGGSIVNCSSTNAFPGSPDSVPYDASKGGVQALTWSLANEVAQYHIRVNSVNPGLIWTPMVQVGMTPEEGAEWARHNTLLGRLGMPEEIAAAFAFLASDESNWMTGQHLIVDGGQLALGTGPSSAIP